jgi:hypothetical protein
VKRSALFLLAICLSSRAWSQSVADAAREAREHQRAKANAKVITDDDVPSHPAGDNPNAVDSGLQSDIDHLREVYQDVCLEASSRNLKQLPPEMQKRVEDAARPVHARLAKNSQEATPDNGSGKLDRDEEVEVRAYMQTLVPAGRGLTAEERQHVGAIHARYAERRKSSQTSEVLNQQTSQDLVKALTDMTSRCRMPSPSKP